MHSITQNLEVKIYIV